ncbi:SDR family NAD(P)-dependent oxidoreductase [Alteriqipengyuania lutimaris]|uniref:SDR family NAD(P)-dependent oxidoreductase n=1 Tax=Alteriqipengyuania lutimaris TaxID=1538146 RepID=UPI001CFE1FB6|nr:SDR family NAD(P)-dependent oxidoreductase [Alteriqipengyuania lutimaris]
MERVGQGIDRAIIFGASGGIGAGLVAELIAREAGTVFAASRIRPENLPDGAQWVRFDLDDEDTIAAAAETVGAPVDCAIVASGLLTLPDGTGPERSYKQIDAEAMARVFHLNTIGPALVAKHFLPLLPRDRRSIFAALSARVGSISDNRIGGWHSYRASKAALNMLIRNFAIELGRTHSRAVCVALHPGTVDTALSEPFQANLPEGQLTAPAQAARNLLDVLDGLGSEDSGQLFDWADKRVEF